MRLGVEVASAIYKQHPTVFEIDKILKLLGSARVLERIKAGEDAARIAASWSADEGRWRLLQGEVSDLSVAAAVSWQPAADGRG